MAFRHQARPSIPVRPLSFGHINAQNEAPASPASPNSQRKHSLAESSEEWVLFSPVADQQTIGAGSTITRTHTASTERTSRTVGLSRLSDFGSLDTAARSFGDEEEDDEELDSLDDGLHAFHEGASFASAEYGIPYGLHLPPPAQRNPEASTDTVLPTHDGLGTFPGTASTLQDQLWAFEKHSSYRRRHARRRSSVQRELLGKLDEVRELDRRLKRDFDGTEESSKRARIEEWRLEQSRAFLEELERERRRSRRRLSQSGKMEGTRDDAKKADGKMHESEEELSLLQRVTRKVIRDLIGIDDDLLSVLFGESLAEEVSELQLSTTPTQTSLSSISTQPTNFNIPKEMQDALSTASTTGLPRSSLTEPWQHKLLERIARELGDLVHHLSEHPGVYETYLKTNADPLPYAGLSTTTAVHPLPAETTSQSRLAESLTTSGTSPSVPLFRPTLQNQSAYADASLWGIDEELEPGTMDTDKSNKENSSSSEAARLAQEREYWERDLDAKMVFRFLLRRFSSSIAQTNQPLDDIESTSNPTSKSRVATSASSVPGPSSSKKAASSIQSTHRIALIRQHHPLVSRSNLPTSSYAAPHRHPHNHHHQQPLRGSLLRNVSRPAAAALSKSRSSCASQSTKKSLSITVSGSSRNYWDLGSSVGAKSVGLGGLAEA
jgi:hypothetical protein